jgi:hypothetical protein
MVTLNLLGQRVAPARISPVYNCQSDMQRNPMIWVLSRSGFTALVCCFAFAALASRLQPGDGRQTENLRFSSLAFVE